MQEPQRARGAARGIARCALPRARFRKIEPAIVEAFDGRIEYALTSHVDYKTELQEALARRGSQSLLVLDVEGAPHDRTFTCAANIDGEQAGVGHGRSKKAGRTGRQRRKCSSSSAFRSAGSAARWLSSERDEFAGPRARGRGRRRLLGRGRTRLDRRSAVTTRLAVRTGHADDRPRRLRRAASSWRW
jgi:hypothetical protein